MGIAGGAVLLLCVEIWIPRAAARLWAEPILYHTWPFWRTLAVLLAPLVFGARFVDTFLHRLVGRIEEQPDEDSFEEEIRTLVTEGHREGLLEEDAREMIEGVIELSGVDVAAIMTPRTDMSSMSHALTWQEALQFVIASSHARIPVYQKNRDDIVGILYIKDLLPVLAKPDEPRPPWTSLLREPYFVPETKPVDVLLQEFQETRNHMAIVLDEYGGVAGVVTMEDVLEEIVGEIVDEYDKDLVDGIREIDERTAEALGRVHIDEINERLADRAARGRRLRHHRRLRLQRIGPRSGPRRAARLAERPPHRLGGHPPPHRARPHRSARPRKSRDGVGSLETKPPAPSKKKEKPPLLFSPSPLLPLSSSPPLLFSPSPRPPVSPPQRLGDRGAAGGNVTVRRR